MNPKYTNSLYRNGLLVLLFALSVIVFGLSPELTSTLGNILQFELLALSMSSVGLFIYTQINFTDELDEPSVKQLAGLIFLSIHILVGMAVFSTYMVQFV